MHEPYLHSLSPFIFEISPGIGLRWYALAYLGAFYIGYLIVMYLAKRGKILVPADKVADFITWGAFGTLIGGRLGYVLFYSPSLLWSFHSSLPFWGVLEINRGGMSAHGGIIGIIVACFLYARREKLPTFHLLDLCTLGGALGIFFGRVANFFNGELYGRECDPSKWYAVKFPTEIFSWGAKDQEKLLALAPAAKEVGNTTDQLWSLWVSSFTVTSQRALDGFCEKIIMAIQEGNAKVASLVAPLLTPRYPSQLIEAVCEGLVVFIVILVVWKKPRRPGIIAGFFGLTYALMRIFCEYFRLPDYDIGYEALGLTRGQWLSIAMVFAVGFYFWLVNKVNNKTGQAPVGGWRS